jgi:hypothetical protein
MVRFQLRLILSFLVICWLTVLAQAQNPIIEYGDTSELKGVEKIFIDTKTDLDLRKIIGIEIHKRLPKLQIVSRPEDSDIHLRFYYDRETYPSNLPNLHVVAIPVAIVEKVIDKDRVRILMGYKGNRPPKRIIFGPSRTSPETDFAEEFVKVYLEANSSAATGNPSPSKKVSGNG